MEGSLPSVQSAPRAKCLSAPIGGTTRARRGARRGARRCGAKHDVARRREGGSGACLARDGHAIKRVLKRELLLHGRRKLAPPDSKASPRGESRYPTSRLSVSPSAFSFRTFALNGRRSICTAVQRSPARIAGWSRISSRTRRVHGPPGAPASSFASFPLSAASSPSLSEPCLRSATRGST